jgi:hypothetical protein
MFLNKKKRYENNKKQGTFIFPTCYFKVFTIYMKFQKEKYFIVFYAL